jgi:AraC-like DNA-binding protein
MGSSWLTQETFFPRSPEGGTSLRAVHFQHVEPSYAARYKLYFRCPLVFGREANSIIFPRVLLDRAQVHADPTVDRMLREAAERLLQGQARDQRLHERVRLLLRYSMDVQQISAERVARCFGLTLRTLRRRLASEGFSLSTLVDEARCRVACDALRREELSLPAVAEMVGFSEASAFFRAFKRWTGRTPGEFRRAALPSGSDGSELAG